jgi:hypothetical protein
MIGGSIFRKDSQLCGTCVYWRGTREATADGGMIVDTSTVGHCECPNNFPIDQRWGTENPCPKYVLFPTLG